VAQTAKKHSAPAAPSHLKLVERQELTRNGYPLEMIKPRIFVGPPPPRPIHTPLYDRYCIEYLRQRVRRAKKDVVYNIVPGNFAKNIVDILGRTRDNFIAYSDGYGITCEEPRKLYEFFESLRIGKTYDFRYIETIRYCGPL
jgi:hypothetical protein